MPQVELSYPIDDKIDRYIAKTKYYQTRTPCLIISWDILLATISRVMKYKNNQKYYHLFYQILMTINCYQNWTLVGDIKKQKPLLVLVWRMFISARFHDDVIKWKHFPRYWHFLRGIHRSPVNSPHKGQWRGALMFSLICAWINGWVNNREAGDLRRHRAHYEVIVMFRGEFLGPGFHEMRTIIYFIQVTIYHHNLIYANHRKCKYKLIWRTPFKLNQWFRQMTPQTICEPTPQLLCSTRTNKSAEQQAFEKIHLNPCNINGKRKKAEK